MSPKAETAFLMDWHAVRNLLSNMHIAQKRSTIARRSADLHGAAVGLGGDPGHPSAVVAVLCPR